LGVKLEAGKEPPAGWAILRALTDCGWFLPIVTAVAMALVLPSVRAGLRSDDYVILGILSASDTLRDGYPSRLDIFNFFDGSPDRTRRLVEIGVLPWWTAPQIRLAFWRPVTMLTHWLDFVGWHDTPALMHLQSVLWFGALVIATALMYRRLMGRGTAAAGVATLFYALDGVHGGAIAWISARNTIVGALFGTIALMLHDRWRRSGSRSAGVMSPMCLALALLSSEGAVAIFGYLVAHAVFLDTGDRRRRLLAVVPHAVIVAAWQVLYVALGYGVVGAAPAYVNLLREPLQFAASLVKNGPILLLAQWTGPSSETFSTLSPRGAALMWAGAVLVLTAVGAILAPLLRRDPVARFWAVGQILAIVPICAAMPHDRYLFFVGLGAMGLLAQFACGLVGQAACRTRWRLGRSPAILLACVLVFVHLVISPVRLVQSASGAPDATMERIADSIRTDPAMPRQRVVIVTVPSAVTVAFSLFIRAYKGQPIPGHTQILSSGDGPVSVYRPDARTLRVRWQGRQEHMLFRDTAHPMTLGERIRLTGTDVEVTAITKDGWPTEATFRFDQNLDDPELRWLRWDSSRFVVVHPPAIGETIVVGSGPA
jgi:hypothetical protein